MKNPIMVVIMAGGMGKRLYPLTRLCPKTMLKIREKPILQFIIEHLVSCGFRNIILLTSYQAKKIENYFKDGEKFGAKITYFRSKKILGTAGPLSLVKNHVKGTFLLVSGDILTKFDFRKMINFHRKYKPSMTIGTQKYKMNVPYGVIDLNNGNVKSIIEKPYVSFNISASVYVLEPSVLKIVKANTMLDMPDLIMKIIKRKQKVKSFSIKNYLLNINSLEDYKKAKKDIKLWSQ